VDLHGLRCRRDREAAGLQLRHRRLLEERLARVAQVRGPVREPARRLELGRDVGELELDRLELRDRLTELDALLGVVRREVEHGLGQAQGQRRDGDAADLERAEELRETHVGVTDQVVVRHPHVVEGELARVEAAPTDAAQLRPHREAGCVLLDDERCVLRLRARQQRDAEGHVRPRVRDERLATVDEPAAVAPLRARADPARVGSGIGLGEAEGTQRASLGKRSEPALALFVVAEQQERQRTDRHVRLPRGGDRLVRQAELLHRRDEADGGHPDAAPLLRDQHPEQPQLAHLAEQVGRAARLLPGLRGALRDLVLCEVAAQPDQIALRLRQREVHGVE
jgi:hypothetical protein